MSQSDMCPICGEGSLNPQVEMLAVKHRGVSKAIKSHYSVCDCCGSEQAGPGELRANKRTMVAFKKQVDGVVCDSLLTQL
jgi:HTH-type transcriptional regulator/antitoxin MqsA